MPEKQRNQKPLNPIQDNLYEAGLEFITACRTGNAERKQKSYKVFLQLFLQRYQVDALPLPSEECLPTEQLEVLDIIYDTQLIDWISSCCTEIAKKRSRRISDAS